jgi:hypothetical protein
MKHQLMVEKKKFDKKADEPAEDEERRRNRKLLEQRKHKLKKKADEYQPNVLGAKQLAESRVLVSETTKKYILY